MKTTSFQPKEHDEEEEFTHHKEIVEALKSFPSSLPKKVLELNKKKEMISLHFHPLVSHEPILIVSRSPKDEYFRFWVVYHCSGIINQPECSMMPFAITDKDTWDYYQWLAVKCIIQALNPRVLAQYAKEKNIGKELEMKIFASILADLILMFLPYGGLYILSDNPKEMQEIFQSNKTFEAAFLNRSSKNDDLLSIPMYAVHRRKINI